MKRQPDAVGNPAYPSLPMFKALLLQRWHYLSDKAVEEGLTDRLSFVRFAWRAASQGLVQAVPGKVGSEYQDQKALLREDVEGRNKAIYLSAVT